MKYTIRTGDAAQDRGELIALWRRNLADADRERRYVGLYENNPAGKGRFWLAVDETGRAAGAAGLLFRKVSLRGSGILSGVTADFVVDRNNRGLGPATGLQRRLLAESGPTAFVYGFPNRRAEPVQRRVGFQILGPMHRWVKILRSERTARKWLPSPPAARAVSFALDPALALISRERRRRRTPGVLSETVRSPDHRFDRLWEKLSNSLPILGDRSAAFLQWRYRGNPNRPYEILAVSRKADREIFGFVIYRMSADGICGVMDLSAENLEDALEITLQEFCLRMREKPVAAISLCYFGNRKFEEILARWNFCKRMDRQNVVLWISPEISTEERAFLLDPNHWHLLEGDDL